MLSGVSVTTWLWNEWILNIYYYFRMTKCTFHKFGTSGNIEKHDALCILPLNIGITFFNPRQMLSGRYRVWVWSPSWHTKDIENGSYIWYVWHVIFIMRVRGNALANRQAQPIIINSYNFRTKVMESKVWLFDGCYLN